MKVMVLSIMLLLAVFAMPIMTNASDITTDYPFTASAGNPALVDFNTLDEPYLEEFAIRAVFRQRTGAHYQFSLYRLQTDNSWLLINTVAYTGVNNNTDATMQLFYRESASGSYELRFLNDSTHKATGTISVTAIDFPSP